jgi:GGDEF domain-containing protein
LRTPLAITREGISLVMDGITGEITAKQKNVLRSSRESIDRLDRIIRELLDISKIEAGRAEVHKETANLVDLVKNVLESFTEKAKEKKLNLVFNAQAPEILINIDYDKIVQVFVNLVNNALKFTEQGSVTISLVDKKDEVECVVADTGRGIAAEDLPKVFEKFSQFSYAVFTKEKGTGLGLSIAKGLVELHNGKIWVESELGHGSKFYFTLRRIVSKERAREQIEIAMKKTIKDSSEMSLLVVAMDYSDKIKDPQNEPNFKYLLENIEKLMRSLIYRHKDVVLNCGDKFMVILSDCNKSSILIVQTRIQKELGAFLTDMKLNDDIKARFGYAVFPEDGNTYHALIEKIKPI